MRPPYTQPLVPAPMTAEQQAAEALQALAEALKPAWVRLAKLEAALRDLGAPDEDDTGQFTGHLCRCGDVRDNWHWRWDQHTEKCVAAREALEGDLCPGEAQIGKDGCNRDNAGSSAPAQGSTSPANSLTIARVQLEVERALDAVSEALKARARLYPGEEAGQ